MPVVIRYIEVLGKYYIAHAASYQSAFRDSVNGFSTRAQAKAFAESNGCDVQRHAFDPLQIA